MKMLSTLLCLFFSFLPVENDERIDALFLKWNRITLNSLRKTCVEMKDEDDRSRCDNRATSMPGFWSIDDDSLNRASVRWKFLRKIDMDAVSLTKNWTIIEVMKSGERIRLKNNVVCYRKSDAVVFTYEYSGGDWVKLNETKVNLSKSDTRFPVGKALLPHNSYPHDVVITNFVHDSIATSDYYLAHTIDNEKRIVPLLKQ